jgi:hypothetical protein
MLLIWIDALLDFGHPLAMSKQRRCDVVGGRGKRDRRNDRRASPRFRCTHYLLQCSISMKTVAALLRPLVAAPLLRLPSLAHNHVSFDDIGNIRQSYERRHRGRVVDLPRGRQHAQDAPREHHRFISPNEQARPVVAELDGASLDARGVGGEVR